MVASEHRPPRLYWIWLAGTGASALGTQMLVFGLVWHAALSGPGTAAAVLSAQVVPRVLLTLHGGALSDRVGALPVMAVANTVLCAVALTGAVVMSGTGPGAVAMIVIALALGTVDAVDIPASASVPKLLVSSTALGRAMAARQVLLHGSVLCGPPLGGAAITVLGLPSLYGAGAACYLVTVIVLCWVRSRARSASSTGPGRGLNRQVRQGVAVVFGTPLLRAVVLLTGAFAMFVIPFSPLVVPVVSAARGWDAVATGAAAGSFGAGMACVTALVLWRGTASRAGAVAAWGMITAAAGIAATAAAPGPAALCLMSLVVGLGTGVFSTHAGPLFLLACPREVVGRAQAVVTLAQWLPLLWANPLIGLIAQARSVTFLLVVWGAGAGVAGMAALFARPLRAAVPNHRARPPEHEGKTG
ncbi:MFS transporter [Nocardiopsis algeriensis]|uniref:MFS family permease n=1 Tax=Nocardiopsis algeriensis TaxID=1478215 RepID=A0A841IPI9_9ACTN|nr:MFS transporter [Nocardiopsis algeriensis]MBB6120012.1 MFS family permease [Nocardiopsis algeriensis]